MPDPRRFEPSPSLGIWVELALGAFFVGVAVPVVVWWRDLDAPVGLQAAMITVGVLAWATKVRFGRRHRGTLVVDDEALTLETAAGRNTVRWEDIHRVHRFGDQLVVETTPPHRRYTLLLDGHEGHQAAILKALRERARTLDLRWMGRIDKLLD